MNESQTENLAANILKRQPLVGVFVKTPSIHIVEVLSGVDLDFIILDAEHGPFDLGALDACILAARSQDMPVLVRVPNKGSRLLQQSLDLGAAGVIVPHVRSGAEAEAIVRACRFSSAGRGFCASGRAAGYGTVDPWGFLEKSDQDVVVIAQIEDADAVENAQEIAQTKHLTAVFVGPADLANSLGEKRFGGKKTRQAISEIYQGARDAEAVIGTFVPSVDAVSAERRQGVSFFAITTDQALLYNAVRDLGASFRQTCSR